MQQLIVCRFSDSDGQADAAANQLTRDFPHMREDNIAVVRRSATGIQIHETAEAREGSRGTAAGRVAGWLLGFANALVGAPLGPIEGATIGQATGQQASVSHDTGFADAFLHELGERLGQGEAALVIIASGDEAATVQQTLADLGGSPTSQDVTPELLMKMID